MYVGRFLVAAPGVAGYRVSSRSFPNRQVVERDGALTVVPTPDAPETDNPYVSYNCVRTADSPADGPVAVVGNGSHVDPVAEKAGLGYPARDALATALLALDFERDDYDTPRIAAVVGPDAATVGVVRRDALLVEAVAEPHLLATYEVDAPTPTGFDVATAAEAAEDVFERAYEHRVCAAGVAWDGDGWATARHNGD